MKLTALGEGSSPVASLQAGPVSAAYQSIHAVDLDLLSYVIVVPWLFDSVASKLRFGALNCVCVCVCV